jgi:hypothetical protein
MLHDQTLLSNLSSTDQFVEHGCEILNLWNNFENKTYLELGVRNNNNFNKIIAKNKFSVDTNGSAMFTGTTDEYFEHIDDSTRFDVVFIDANHDYDFVIKDLIHSSKHCNEWILLHDCVPPNAAFTRADLCSDSYRVLYYLLHLSDIDVFVMNNNFGLTFVRMPANIAYPTESFTHTTYEDFEKVLSNYKRHSAIEIVSILNDS